jgi:TM2 domain-containing membrane protein YozV
MPDIFSLFIVCLVICFLFLALLLKSLISGRIEEAKMIKNYRELFSKTKQSAENGDV